VTAASETGVVNPGPYRAVALAIGVVRQGGGYVSRRVDECGTRAFLNRSFTLPHQRSDWVTF
jgi:hypothetical protein